MLSYSSPLCVLATTGFRSSNHMLVKPHFLNHPPFAQAYAHRTTSTCKGLLGLANEVYFNSIISCTPGPGHASPRPPAAVAPYLNRHLRSGGGGLAYGPRTECVKGPGGCWRVLLHLHQLLISPARGGTATSAGTRSCAMIAAYPQVVPLLMLGALCRWNSSKTHWIIPETIVYTARCMHQILAATHGTALTHKPPLRLCFPTGTQLDHLVTIRLPYKPSNCQAPRLHCVAYTVAAAHAQPGFPYLCNASCREL